MRRWAVLLVIGGLGLGLIAGYARWGLANRRAQAALAVAAQVARAPSVMALSDARPAAVVDLATREGVALTRAQWRYTQHLVWPAGGRGAAGFATSRWAPIDAATLEAPGSRRHGRPGAYSLELTIPDRVGDLDMSASTAVLELSIDGYAEAWVDGQAAPVLGRNGSSLLLGHGQRNRIILTREPRPTQHIAVVIAGVGSLRSEPEADFTIRSATIDFVAPAVTERDSIGRIVRLDPALDGIVPPGARIEKVAAGIRASEGPVWIPDGYLLFSDFAANLIYRWSPDDGLSIFRTKSGHAGPDIAEFGLPGSNGLAVDREGRLTIAEHGRRRIVRIEPDRSVTVLADAYQGRRLNSPNDLVYKSDGTLYFTDPPFGLPRGHKDRRRELPYSGVFRWSAGKLHLLTTDLLGPNGLAFSPDERSLYIADWTGEKLMRYDVDHEGTLTNARVFLPRAIDGIKTDEHGNVYVAGRGAATIVSPDGRTLGTIEPPEGPSNVAWGDADYRTLYLTAATGVYRIRLTIPGAGRWSR
jgi:gluconolactonase